MDDRGDRLDWIDVARGIGILAVVVGHVWTRGGLRDAMYSFHMPLFFLLSGLLAKPQPAGAFTLRQLSGQMRPYFAFLLSLLLVDWAVETGKGGRPIFHDWPSDLVPVLLGGTWLKGPFTIFWFVPCLMVARILYNLSLSRWPDPAERAWWGIAALMACVAYAAGLATDMSPLGLLSVPMAFVLLWIGHRWSAVDWRRWMLVPILALALPGFFSLVPTLNMKAGDYGWPVLSMAAAIATSVLVLRIAKAIAPSASWLGALGRASLVIMYCHVALIHYLTPYLGKPWLMGIALLGPFALYHAIRLTALRRAFL